MGIIYRKTALGVDEVRHRSNRLSPRERRALILVDGQRSDTELAALIQVQSQETLASLEASGLIEVIMHTAATAPPAAAAAPARPVADLGRLRREAVRRLLDQAGPPAETLAIRIEKSADLETLKPLLQQARGMIANVRGEQAAADYIAALSAL